MEWVESTGSSIEEAKEQALDRLGVHEDDAEFEVLADVKTGFLGRVKEEARVRARVRPAVPRAKEERRKGGRGRSRGGRGGNGNGNRGRNKGGGGKGGDNRSSGGRSGGSRRGGADAGAKTAHEGDRGRGDRGRDESGQAQKARSGDGSGSRRASGADRDKNRNRGGRRDRAEERDDKVSDEPTMPLTEQADLAEEFVRGLADRFGTEVSFQREQVEDDEIRITVNGDDLGRMVGRRGTTAGAIDELVRTVLQRQAGSARNGRIRVDVGGVRARRAEALANFSRAQAAEVRESQTSRALEPMGAADRKIVHDALTDEAGVATISEGEDPHRRVVIVPEDTGHDVPGDDHEPSDLGDAPVDTAEGDPEGDAEGDADGEHEERTD